MQLILSCLIFLWMTGCTVLKPVADDPVRHLLESSISARIPSLSIPALAITRVLADNLRRLTGSTNIQPSSNFITRDYSALEEVRIERFDPGVDGALLLECTWKLQPLKSGGHERSSGTTFAGDCEVVVGGVGDTHLRRTRRFRR